MSRLTKKDFKELLQYIEKFSLKDLSENKDYLSIVSIYHKKYISYFVFITELEDNIPEKEYLYFKETNSDLITSLFHLSTGNYKSCKLLLRSSLECFFKAFALSYIPNIDKEKSVYELFDKVKALDFFKTSPNKEQFNNLHSVYKELCRDVHTAEKVNMANIASLNFFPKFSKKDANKITNLILKIIPSYCFLLATKYNKEFHKIHHSHKEIILLAVEKKLRPLIMNTNN